MKTIATSDTFYRLHSKIIWYNNLSGLVAPAFPYKGKCYHVVLEMYAFVMNALAVVSSVAFIGGVIFVPDLEFITVSSTCTCTSTLVYVAILGLLTVGKRQEFNILSERAGEIFDLCSCDPLDVNKTFTKKFRRNVKLLTIYVNLLLIPCSIGSLLYVSLGYVQKFKSLGFSGDSCLEFPLWMPFDYKESPYLDIAFSIQLFAIMISVWRKSCAECLLLSYLNCQIQCLRHVKYTLERVFTDETVESNSTETKLQILRTTGGGERENEKNLDGHKETSQLTSREEKLNHWIPMHQEVLKLGKTIMHAYDGIIASHMVSIIAIVTFGMFTALQKQQGPEGRIQFTGVIFYSISTMCSYYLLCHFGSLVKFESQTVAQLGYFSNWYDADKKIRNSMKIIFERTKSPLLISAFGSPLFDVSKETYLTFMKSIVSFYLTLSQFNDKFKK